jgi:hypothetical protein
MVYSRAAMGFVAAIALSSAALQGQTFTWGPAHNLKLPLPLVFQNLSPTDIDNDGNTDIVLTGWTPSPDNTTLDEYKYIFKGDGAGNFGATPIAVHESNSSYSYATVQFFDVNGDGYPDEVYSYAGYTFCCIPPTQHAGVFAVLLGDGKGNFTQTTSIPQPITLGNTVQSYGASVLAAGSFRNNGKLDFATVFPNPSNPGHGVLTVYLNDGGGIFHVGSTITVTGNSPITPVTGDFDGDGRLDIAWLDYAAEPGTTNRYPIHCLAGNGDGTFGPDKICYTLDGLPEGLLAENLNGDLKSDLLVLAGPKVAVTGAQSRVATLLAKQTSGFYWASNVSLPTPGAFGIPYAYGMPLLKFLDLNADGHPDLIVGGQGLFPGLGNGTFGRGESIGFPGNFNPPYFAPLKKGGLPAVFYSANDQGDWSTKLTWQLNTSPK